MARRAKRGMTFRLLVGLVHWLERLLQEWSQDAANGTEPPAPEFGWEAPEDWLRRATPQPPEDWVRRVRNVLPDWEPSKPEPAVPLPEVQAESGNRQLPETDPLAAREPQVPVRIPHSSRGPERLQLRKAAPQPPQGLPVETRHTEARPLEPAPALRRALRHRIEEAVPLRIALAPPNPPLPGEIIPRKRGPSMAPEPEVRKRPPDRQVPSGPQPDRLSFGQADQNEIAAGQVTYGERRWPEVEPVKFQPRYLPEAGGGVHRPAQREPLVGMPEDVTFAARIPPIDQDLLWMEEDRWPALPERMDEQGETEGNPARRVRLDREQEGEDAWTV